MARRAKWDKREYFEKKLASYPKNMSEALKSGLTKNAALLLAKMKSKVPRKTGKLASTIRVGRNNDLSYTIKAGGAATTKKVRAGFLGAGSDYDYAHAIEFGTKPHKNGGIFKGSRHPGTKARPFFFSSYRSQKRALKKDFKEIAKRAVAK